MIPSDKPRGETAPPLDAASPLDAALANGFNTTPPKGFRRKLNPLLPPLGLRAPMPLPASDQTRVAAASPLDAAPPLDAARHWTRRRRWMRLNHLLASPLVAAP